MFELLGSDPGIIVVGVEESVMFLKFWVCKLWSPSKNYSIAVVLTFLVSVPVGEK